MTEIFAPFAQADNIGDNVGTGLGLSISRQFVRLMGGDIVVESKVGIGSVFKFDVPFELSQAEEIDLKPTVQRIIGLAPDQPDYRILIVEDRMESRVLLKRLLQTVGFQVKDVANGQQGMQAFQDWQPDFVWMDMRMPVMDGYEATKRIKGTGAGKKTPVVALTASAFEEERHEVLAAGCDDFLRKPFQEAEIFETMRKYLGVRYIYAEEIALPTIPSEADVQAILTPAALDELPVELLIALQQAALDLNAGSSMAVIDQIRPLNAVIADQMARLVNAYQIDKLYAIIESKIGKLRKEEHL